MIILSPISINLEETSQNRENSEWNGNEDM